MVIMGRLISPQEVAAIGAQAQAHVSMLPPADSRGANRQVETERFIQVYHAYDDVYGHPILTLQVDVPREITQRGYAAVYYAFAYLLIAAVMIEIGRASCRERV